MRKMTHTKTKYSTTGTSPKSENIWRQVSFSQPWHYSNPKLHALAIYIFEPTNYPRENTAYSSILFKHTKVLTVWTSQFTDKRHHIRISITKNKLRFHCLVPNIWLARFENVGIYCFSSAICLVFIVWVAAISVNALLIMIVLVWLSRGFQVRYSSWPALRESTLNLIGRFTVFADITSNYLVSLVLRLQAHPCKTVKQ